MNAELVDAYRFCRSYDMPALHALQCARRGGMYEAYSWWRRQRRSQQVGSVKLNAAGLDRLEAIAEYHGVTVREYMEALMHYAISTHERPGSWEAGGFDISNYRGPEGYADRWF